MPEPVVKLNFKSLDEVVSEAMKVKSTLKRELNPGKLVKSIESLCQLGEIREKEGNLELAYIYYYRCWLSFERLRDLEEYEKDTFYYKTMVKDFLRKSVPRLECLKPTLLNIYDRENEECFASKNVVKESNDRFNEKNPPTQYSSMNSMKELSINGACKCLSSMELYYMITNRKMEENTTLIIDVRPSDDFEKSQMEVEDVINIPMNELPDGLTPSKILDAYLKVEFKPFFEKRKEYDWVVLVDWFSNRTDINDTRCSIGKIMNTLMKWDVGKKYKRNPVVLEGGFEDWLLCYPLRTTNSKIVPPRMEISNLQPLNDINFPSVSDLDTAFIEENKNHFRPRPTFDRSKKPVFQGSENELLNNNNNNNNETFAENHTGNDDLECRQETNNDAFDRSDIKKTHIALGDSDVDDELCGEAYSQRGRRSALASTSSQMIYRDEKMSNNGEEILVNDRNDRDANEHGNEDADSDESETKFVGENDMESISSMRKSSSTPDISKLSINEGGSRPPVDRSTKPISSDDPLENEYSRSEIGTGLVGLKNLGNTCYMNSIIQCLSNTEPLKQKLLSLDPRKINHSSKTQGRIANALRVIFNQLWRLDSGSVSCKELKTIIGEHRDSFRGYEQQDSHEFLTILIDWLHEDLKETPVPGKLDGADVNSGEKAWGEFTSKNDSIIRRLFYGQLKSTVSCSVCHKESITFEPFSNLSLPLPAEETCSLADCLKLYVSNENILGWQCPGCKTSRSATKKLDITKLPPLLVIHLKRFTSDGMCRKRVTNVEFPSLLDMSNFVIGNEHRFSRYGLYAVSNHYGTMESGHYTAYCMNNPSERWYKFDDQEVTWLTGSVPKLQAAYIVFYQFITN